METWKDVVGYEGLYQVSSIGRVKSLGRVVIRKDGQKKVWKGAVIKNSPQGTGYTKVGLSKNGFVKNHTVHRLMGYAFLGLTDDMCIDHINNIRDDNRIENLRVCTKRQNSSYPNRNVKKTSKYIGVHKRNDCKSWCASIKINGKKVMLGYYENELDAADAYNRKLEQISAILNNT